MRERPRDINVQVGVADAASTLRYYSFNDPALNTFDRSLMEWRVANTPYRVIGEIEVPVERLDAILRKHMPSGRRIDFISIDVEGLDLAVLRSNDWSAFRPHCVLVEALGISLEAVMDSEVCGYLRGQGYELFSKLFNSLIFRERSASS